VLLYHYELNDIAACWMFDTGDIIVGLKPADGSSDWWHATLNGVTGIIPLTHVVQLHSADDGQLCNLWSAAATCSDDLNSSANSSFVGLTVVADSDLTAQLDYELTFTRGDVIYVLEDLGDGFAIGQCNGAVGQFPLCFCTPTDPQVTATLPSPEMPPSINAPSQSSGPSWKKCHARPSSYTLANTRSQDCSVIPYCMTLYEFTRRSSSELSFGAGEIVFLISHLDDDWCFGELDGKCGAFPTSYVDIIVDCDFTSADQLQPTPMVETSAAVPMVTQTPLSPQVSRSSNAGELYGRFVCDFDALNVNEVSASEGETVTVLQRIGPDWLEVRHDNGKVGLCPAGYVELFGAEPEPTVKPDIRTPSVVKPKLPVKPKLLSTSKSGSLSPGDIDLNRKSPVSAELPVFSTQPVMPQPDENTFLPRAADVLTSPTAETVRPPAGNVTNSHRRSLDELIEAQLTSAKSGSAMPAASGKENKPIPPGSTLNGLADVSGQSAWCTFTHTEQASVTVMPRKPPPPPRPAPSRPPPTSVMPPSLPNCAAENGISARRRPGTNLIEFSPDHNQSK